MSYGYITLAKVVPCPLLSWFNSTTGVIRQEQGVGRERLHYFRGAFPSFSREVTTITPTHIPITRTNHTALPNVGLEKVLFHVGRKEKRLKYPCQ